MPEINGAKPQCCTLIISQTITVITIQMPKLLLTIVNVVCGSSTVEGNYYFNFGN